MGTQATIDELLAHITKLKKREGAHVRALSVSLVFVVLAWTSMGLQMLNLLATVRVDPVPVAFALLSVVIIGLLFHLREEILNLGVCGFFCQTLRACSR